MAGFFEKVAWAECTGDQNPACARFMNKERLPAYKAKCGDCGSKAREVTEPDKVKLAIASGVLLLVVGSGYWYVRAKVFNVVRDVAASVTVPGSPASQVVNTPPAPTPSTNNPTSASAITWNVVSNKRDTITQLVSGDFDHNGDIHTSHQAFTAGDRLRIEASYKGEKLYAFYRSAAEAQSLGSETGGRATLPKGDNWFQLDNKTGTEEFILVSSAKTLSDLEPLTGTFDPVSLDSSLNKLQSNPSISVVRIRIPHQ